MKNITKAQLAAENAALRKQLGDALFDLALWKGKAEGSLREIDMLRKGYLHPKSGKPIPTFLLPEHMQRAKEMAMKSGITVKVGA
jgi:hypothetical protein